MEIKRLAIDNTYRVLFSVQKVCTVLSIPFKGIQTSFWSNLNDVLSCIQYFTFSAFERMHFTKYGSAWPSVSISLLKEACNKSSVIRMLFYSRVDNKWLINSCVGKYANNLQYIHKRICFWKGNWVFPFWLNQELLRITNTL